MSDKPNPVKASQSAKPRVWRFAWLKSVLLKYFDKVILLLIALILVLPLLPLISSWLSFDGSIWQHLWDTQLPGLLGNTLILVLLVGVGSFLLGTGLAWLVVMYDFAGRNILQWALMLPLAIPPYILAFVFLGFTDFGGPLQSLLNGIGLGINWLPDIRHPLGVGLVFTLSLYPYVYLLMRAALLRKGKSSYESARTLGYGKFAAFWRLIIPLTRPAWVAGLALVLMETLADFGAVSIFNYDTFTTAIYKSWFGFFSLATAAQLASILLLFVGLAVIAEKWGRGHSQYIQSGSSLNQYRQKLTGWSAIWASVAAWLVFALAFGLPLVQMLVWVVSHFAESTSGTTHLLWNSLRLAVCASLICLLMAGILIWLERLRQLKNKNSKSSTRGWQLLSEITLLGYALPGTVLAVGIVISFNYIDSLLLSGSGQQWLTGGLFALLFAYLMRFLRIAYGPLANAMGQIKPSIIEAAMSLGASKKERVYRVYVPLLRPGVFSALLLVFVEVMKEMPATLLMRPFGWDTLAVRIYELTSEGEWQLAALPAVLLVVVGVVPVVFLIKKSEV